jgi:hypothetical protein
MNRHPDLDLTDELLREWGHFFRDNRKPERCRSIESRFQATSDDFGPNGWGDLEAAPRTSPARSYSLLRAVFTHDAVQQLPITNKWAITYGFAYQHLPKFIVLRCMRKYTGRRINWQAFLEALDIGRFRVHTTICATKQLTDETFFRKIVSSS